MIETPGGKKRLSFEADFFPCKTRNVIVSQTPNWRKWACKKVAEKRCRKVFTLFFFRKKPCLKNKPSDKRRRSPQNGTFLRGCKSLSRKDGTQKLSRARKNKSLRQKRSSRQHLTPKLKNRSAIKDNNNEIRGVLEGLMTKELSNRNSIKVFSILVLNG